MIDTELDYAEDDPFWDTFYDLENLLDYWQDDRIDHAFVTYQQWADMVVF
jgi:hypothetical protein